MLNKYKNIIPLPIKNFEVLIKKGGETSNSSTRFADLKTKIAVRNIANPVTIRGNIDEAPGNALTTKNTTTEPAKRNMEVKVS
jgi:hypothetical protein